jgi:uncharacterized protein YdaU (DUF1376 family)
VDTADLSNEEVGAYMRLLCHQWDHGFVPEDAKKRARIVKVGARKFSTIWEEIGRFFVSHKDGFVNPRMEEERRKQAAYSAKMAEAGAKGGLAKAASQAKAEATDEARGDSYLSLSLPQEREIDTPSPSLSGPATAPRVRPGVDW